MSAPGPFHASQIRDGDPYELSDGHPVYCSPAGKRHATSDVDGALVIASDPAVEDSIDGTADPYWTQQPTAVRANEATS